jgi:membrane-associated protease RseP (regulator of RpoE activity)
MNSKLVTIIAAIVLLPVAAFTQPPPNAPNPPNPPDQPGAPRPGGPPPGGPEHREKKVPVTFLGVETSDIPSVVSEQLGLPKGFGLVVDYVVPDSPAAAAGVQQNDILKMLNDQILTEPEQLAKLIRSNSEGTTVTLTIIRKGKEQKLTAKLIKKEVPDMFDLGPGRRGRPDFKSGDFGMNEFRQQMNRLQDQLGDETRGMVHDAVISAREQVAAAGDEAARAINEAFGSRGRFKITSNARNGTMKTTNINIGKAQVVFSDEKGELRIEKIGGKKVLTAKDPQGLLLFSGPVETKEDLDNVPPEVRQRFEQFEKKELPAISPNERAGGSDASELEESPQQNDNSSTQQVQSL